MDAKTKGETDELLEKLAELLGSASHGDGRNKTFDEMELAANAIGDRVSAKVLQRSVNRGETQQAEQPEACRCPKCNSPGKQLDEPDPRLVETLRGEVQWNEDEYFCRKCRKSFFPSER